MNKPNTIENDQYWKICEKSFDFEYIGKIYESSKEEKLCYLEIIKVIRNQDEMYYNLYIGKQMLLSMESIILNTHFKCEYLGMKLFCPQCKNNE